MRRECRASEVPGRREAANGGGKPNIGGVRKNTIDAAPVQGLSGQPLS